MKRLMLGALLLSACSVGPDYTPPAIDPPPAFVSQQVLDALAQPQDNSAIAANWWEGFNDAFLNDLVKAGLEKNHNLAAAYARLERAEAVIALADSGDALNASAALDGSVDEQRSLNGGDRIRSEQLFGSIGAALPLDLFGRTQREVEAARAQYTRTEQELRGLVLSTSSEVASEYLNLRGNQRQLELLEESVELQEQTLSIVRTRYDAGLSPELDVQRATTTVENLRARIPPLLQQLQDSRNRLAVLTGAYPGAYEAQLTPVKPLPDYATPLPAVLPLDILRARPDVRRAEAVLQEAVARIGVAEAQFYPAMTLTGSIAIGASGGTVPGSDVFIASLGGLLEQFLTDGGARRAGLAIAEAEAREALALYQQALRDAIYDVEQSLAAIRASTMRQQSLSLAVTASERSFMQAETLYQQGLISFLDVVDAQRTLADARQALASERTQYATEIAALFEAMGTEES